MSATSYPLDFFHTVSLTPEASRTDIGSRILSFIQQRHPAATTEAGRLSFSLGSPKTRGGRALIVSLRKGPFLKKCPGTPRYLCCGYQVLAWAEGCPLGCSYCILSGYFRKDRIILFANTNQLLEEITCLMGSGRHVHRLGTGEFTDSLFLEPLAHLHQDLVPLIGGSLNIILEIKTKTDQIDPLLSLEHRGKTILAWSLNTPRMAANFESALPEIEKRLAAAARVSSAGFPVAFHFDPIIHHQGWEAGYQTTVEMMADYLKSVSPVWISMGSLRFPQTMFKNAGMRKSCMSMAREELHSGDDGKMRYLRPLRVMMYRHLAEMLKKAFPGSTLYLCMENRDVWEASLGWGPSTSREVSLLLDNAVMNIIRKKGF